MVYTEIIITWQGTHVLLSYLMLSCWNAFEQFYVSEVMSLSLELNVYMLSASPTQMQHLKSSLSEFCSISKTT